MFLFDQITHIKFSKIELFDLSFIGISYKII